MKNVLWLHACREESFMDERILVTQTGECFRAHLNRSKGSFDDERRHEFRVEDLKANRGVRGVIVVFTRMAIVNAGDFKSREHILYWNAIRRAFDENRVSFEIEPEDPDKYIELKVKWADIDGSQGQAVDENIVNYLMAKAYWLGYKYKPYENPVPTYVDLESEEDLDYLGVTKNDMRRVADRMKQRGLLESLPFMTIGPTNPTEKLLRQFEGGPREVVLAPKSQYSSYRQLSKILESATTSLTIVDNYVNSTLLDMLRLVRDKVRIRVLTQKPGGDFRLALQKFQAELERTIEVRVHDGDLHDRFIIVDKTDYYSSGTSLKQVGDKLSILTKFRESAAIAELQRRIEKIWEGASPL